MELVVHKRCQHFGMAVSARLKVELPPLLLSNDLLSYFRGCRRRRMATRVVWMPPAM